MSPIAKYLILVAVLFTAIALKANTLADSVATGPARHAMHLHKKHWPEFNYPGRQFFFEGQLSLQYVNVGVRFMAGYHLGQYGIIGGGIGLDAFLIGFTAKANTDPYSGYYFPLVAHYEGDILKKRVTPFYSVDAGYAFRYSIPANNNDYITVTPLNHPVYQYLGGFTGAFDFGVKLYANRGIYAKWSACLNMQQARDKYSNYYYNSIGQDIKVSYNSPAFIFIPGVKITCGF